VVASDIDARGTAKATACSNGTARGGGVAVAAAEGAAGVEDEVVEEVCRAADEEVAAAGVVTGAAGLAAGAADRETAAGLATVARAAAVACPASGLSRSVKRKSSRRSGTCCTVRATAAI
jgi:hypothetical protein